MSDICLFLTLSSSFKKARGQEREKEKEKHFWHSICTYVALLAIRPGRNQDLLSSHTDSSSTSWSPAEPPACLLSLWASGESPLLSMKPPISDCNNLFVKCCYLNVKQNAGDTGVFYAAIKRNVYVGEFHIPLHTFLSLGLLNYSLVVLVCGDPCAPSTCWQVTFVYCWLLWFWVASMKMCLLADYCCTPASWLAR